MGIQSTSEHPMHGHPKHQTPEDAIHDTTHDGIHDATHETIHDAIHVFAKKPAKIPATVHDAIHKAIHDNNRLEDNHNAIHDDQVGHNKLLD